MAAASWLMNLGFAAGTGAAAGVPAVTGQEGGTFAGWQRPANRRKKILRDDEEFLVFAESAVPEILKNIFK